jgi:CheY-like chemotaxis protein
VLLAGHPNLLRRNLVLFLQREGLDIAVVSSGREALCLAPGLRPSAIVLDADLNDVPGLNLCQCLTDMQQTCGIPVILFTLDPTPRFEAAARTAGAYSVFKMPLDASDIVLKVANAILQMPAAGDAASVTLEDGAEYPSLVKEAHAGRNLVLDLPRALRDRLVGVHHDVQATFRFVDAAYSKTTWVGALHGNGTSTVNAHLQRITERYTRREAHRKPIELPIRYKLPCDGYCWGTIRDLSIGGLRMTGAGPLPNVGDHGEFSFTLGIGGKPVRVAGVVRRVRSNEAGGYECGLAFYKLPEPVRDLLLAYLFETNGQDAGAVAV